MLHISLKDLSKDKIDIIKKCLSDQGVIKYELYYKNKECKIKDIDDKFQKLINVLRLYKSSWNINIDNTSICHLMNYDIDANYRMNEDDIKKILKAMPMNDMYNVCSDDITFRWTSWSYEVDTAKFTLEYDKDLMLVKVCKDAYNI